MKNSHRRAKPLKVRTAEDLQKLEAIAQAIAQRVGPAFDAAGAGFALLGFTFGEGGWATWVSNAERPDMIRALREMADSLEEEIDVPPLRSGDPRAH